jgi:hypothetical protein
MVVHEAIGDALILDIEGGDRRVDDAVLEPNTAQGDRLAKPRKGVIRLSAQVEGRHVLSLSLADSSSVYGEMGVFTGSKFAYIHFRSQMKSKALTLSCSPRIARAQIVALGCIQSDRAER